MRRELYLFAVITLSILPTVSALGQPAAAVDFSMRRALYFTGNEAKIDKTGKYVAENGTMDLNQSQATKCEQDGCYFNLGFIVFRKPAAGPLVTYATLKTQTLYTAGIEIAFAENEAIREQVLSLKLAPGTNKVTFRVDPHEKTAESDEGNNSFAVTITVKPKVVLSNPNPGKPEARNVLFAHAGQAQLSCPETIVVGVITPAAGWMDYNRRALPFENLTIVQTAQGAKISCDYDQGRYALDRLVPGRVCTRDGANSPHLSCRAIPTKK